MRITTFDHDVSDKPCDIEVPLRRLASSTTAMEAAYWHKLLELAEHLQSSGPEPELWGHIILQELMLSKPQPPDPVRDQKMKEFMDEWRVLNPDPTTWRNKLSREMRRRFPPKPEVRVTVRV